MATHSEFSPGESNGQEAWRATVDGVKKSDMSWSDWACMEQQCYFPSYLFGPDYFPLFCGIKEGFLLVTWLNVRSLRHLTMELTIAYEFWQIIYIFWTEIFIYKACLIKFVSEAHCRVLDNTAIDFLLLYPSCLPNSCIYFIYYTNEAFEVTEWILLFIFSFLS